MTGWLNSSPNNQNNSDSSSSRVSVSTWGLRLRHGGFAALRLSPAGWLALLSPGVVIGLLIARLTGGSFVLWGVIGGVTIWILAAIGERMFAGNRPTRFDVAPAVSPDELERVAEAARYAGIKFEHHETAANEPGQGLSDDASSMFVTKAKYATRLQNIIALKQHPQSD